MNVVRGYILAKDASRFSKFDKATSRHLGCVICYKNQVISVGWNCEKDHPAQKKYNKERGFDTSGCKNSLHAEMHALVLCKDYDVNWSKASIFVYRQFANGKQAMAKPCKACQKALEDRGIKLKNIHYTTDNGNIDGVEI